ncbi:MAG TPA: transaldolase [Kofleriaceae bacterium]|jgi:transaldolase|nr:transaldolase [Kofleriaceae bacterium]
MTQTLLQQLAAMTVVVADSGDFNSIKKLKPRDATTNPSLLVAAAQMPDYADVVDGALRWAAAEAKGDESKVIALATDRLAIEFGLRILDIVPGRVSTEVDARLSFDTAKTVDKAHHLIGLYQAAGASRDRVLIKIASTWEGIRAAEILEKEGIHCNLTLLFGMHQAVACAHAGVTLISPFVGRILDWHKHAEGRDSYPPAEDPGVLSVTRIYNYFKHHGHKTEVMGASFRNLGEIVELAGCDLLTIAPNFLTELGTQTGALVRKLDPERARAMTTPRLAFDEAAFRAAHEADKMARDKLAEGIAGFSKAAVTLEKLLGERYRAIQGKCRAGDAAREFFRAYDLDGDGFITREEWAGSLAVFLALDVDADGKITPEEMAAGLGGAFVLAQ